MSKVAIKGADTGTGVFTLESPATNTNRTLVLPDEAGTVLTTASASVITQPMLSTSAGVGGPSFLAEMSGDQSFTSATNTKVNYDNEIFDSNVNYDTSTKRFTPTVAGYYFLGANIIMTAPSDGSYEQILRVYKNGFNAFWSNNNQNSTAHFNGFTASGMIYLNGTTDYVETYYVCVGQNISSAVASLCTFYGFLVRAA